MSKSTRVWMRRLPRRALPATRLERPPWYYFIGDSDGLSGPVTGTGELPVNPIEACLREVHGRRLFGLYRLAGCS